LIEPAALLGLAYGSQLQNHFRLVTVLAESLLECSVYSPVHASARYVQEYRTGDCYQDIDPESKKAMDRLVQGHHWNSSGVAWAPGPDQAARAVALGLFYRKSLPTLCDMVRIDSGVTHRSYKAQESSVAVGLAIATLAEREKSKLQVLDPILDMMSGESSTLMSSLGDLKSSIGTQTFPEFQDEVVQAFALFMRTSSFRDAMDQARSLDRVNCSALTGALAGTYYGLHHVRTHLIETGALDLDPDQYIQHLDHMLWLSAPEIPDDV